MTKVFTEEEVIKLCKAIRAHPSLYDPDDGNFGKSLANKQVWDEIAGLFDNKGFTADDIKLKWKNLRDTMALLLRKTSRDPNSWRFYEYCSFLNNYERRPRKNGRKQPSINSGKERALKTLAPISGSDRSLDEPPEKQFKPTMVVNSTLAKSEDMVEQSDSSRDSNFEETHDSLLLKHFVAQTQNGHQNLLQTPMLSQVQSPYPSMHSRDVFEIFGEETAVRLRAIAESGNRTLFIHARRKINEVLDQVELELYSKRDESQSSTVNEL
ncbi:MADF DNA bdg domain containing protein [Aphelenchoides bicaudatus]|nr:MADF DNA bdg domain containing protein [Aphelenchoides bicaudatus]